MSRGRAFFVQTTQKNPRVVHHLFRTEYSQVVPGRKRTVTNHVVVASAAESQLHTGHRVPARDVVMACDEQGKVLSYDDLAELERGSVAEVLCKAGFEVVGAM